jgi:CheY-like chemotaxis protein
VISQLKSHLDPILLRSASHSLGRHGLVSEDDEAAVRELAKNVLEKFDYRTLVASDGAEAMAIYAERRDEIQAVLTDLMMLVMDGPATIRALQRLDPEVKIMPSVG